MNRKFSKVWTCGSLEMRADKHRQTDIDTDRQRHTDTMTAILCTPPWGQSNERIYWWIQKGIQTTFLEIFKMRKFQASNA